MNFETDEPTGEVSTNLALAGGSVATVILVSLRSTRYREVVLKYWHKSELL